MLIKMLRPQLFSRAYGPVWMGLLTVVLAVSFHGDILTHAGDSLQGRRSPMLSWGLAPTLATETATLTDATAQETASETAEYDRLMQSGYAATQFREYDQALVYFRSALAIRPRDIYAQQAILNVETYQALQNRPVVPLWFITTMIALGIVILLLMLRRGIVQSQRQFLMAVTERQHHSQDLQNRLRNQIFGNESPKSNVTFNPRSPLVAGVSTPQESTSPTSAPGEQSGIDWMGQLLMDLKSANPDRRRLAIWELARRGDSRAVPALSNLMTTSDSQERDLILGALSQISGRTLRPISQALAASLRDQNPEVRRNAVRDLTRLHELMNQMNQLLTTAAQDQDYAVKQTAAKALHQSPPATGPQGTPQQPSIPAPSLDTDTNGSNSNNSNNSNSNNNNGNISG